MNKLFITILALTTGFAVSGQGVCEPPVYYFNSKSNSGNGTVGSYYTFSNVLSNINAVVTITKIQNASINNNNVDVNSPYPLAWQPFITFPNTRNNNSDTSYIEFKVEFHTTSSGGGLTNQSCLAMTIIDCDGNGNNTYREMVKVSLPGTPMGISGSSISVFEDAQWMLFKSGTATFNNIDTNNLAAMGQVNFPSSTNTFYMRVGVVGPVNGNTQRQFSFYFKSFELNVPLPVKLNSFNANASENSINLNWSVSEEKNFSHYEVYRSFDGQEFEMIGRVNSNYTGSITQYSFNDLEAIGHTMNYYKLKIVDLDGNSSWSYIRLVNLNSGLKAAFSLYPSPSNGILNINSEYEGEAEVRILDIYGKLVYSLPYAFGNEALQLDLKHLDNGIYSVQLVNESNVMTTFKWMKSN